MSALTCWLASWVLFAPVLGTLANGADEPLTWGHVFRYCGPLAAFFGAVIVLGALQVYLNDRRDKRRAQSLVSEALLQAGQQADPQNTQSLLQDAIRAFPAIDLPDVERLADQLGVPIRAAVGPAFRQAELRYLQELLASPEHLPKRVEGAALQIQRAEEAINVPMRASQWRTHPSLGIELMERIIDGRRTLEVLLTVRTTGPIAGRGASYGAFVSESELPTGEDVAGVLGAENRFKSDIARRFRKDVLAVLRTVVEFIKGRRLMAELDQVVIHERKFVPVVWFENVTSLAGSLLGQTALRTHFWGRSLMADYIVAVDMARLSEGGSVQWDFREDQVRFEYVPV